MSAAFFRPERCFRFPNLIAHPLSARQQSRAFAKERVSEMLEQNRQLLELGTEQWQVLVQISRIKLSLSMEPPTYLHL